ncbi:DUF1707 domain-containing protein [Actinoplanes sp. NPDC049681]|uniref:DUF1707 domain-containing protein n=1 Tax=Actinoplanes sp. NPDC049681 TaxID=3363905 RepID=UPI0037A9289D
MAKEVARREIESMRAADADRHTVAEQLKSALDEGRLSLAEYDERVRDVYAARTYADLMPLVADLPKPGQSAAEVKGRRADEVRREARRLPTALMVLWTIWGSVAAVNLAVWIIVATTVAGDLYPWPVWLLVPGAALAVTTVGVQTIRRRRRR